MNDVYSRLFNNAILNPNLLRIKISKEKNNNNEENNNKNKNNFLNYKSNLINKDNRTKMESTKRIRKK